MRGRYVIRPVPCCTGEGGERIGDDPILAIGASRAATHPPPPLGGRSEQDEPTDVIHDRRSAAIAAMFVLAATTLLASCSGAPLPGLPRGQAPLSFDGPASVSASSAVPHDSNAYGEVLERFVDGRGRVDYAGLRADRAGLDRYAAALGAVPRATYQAWSEAEKIALLINAYNAMTLVSIIDRYPVDSIRDIRGVWRGRRFNVVGEPLSLDAIEHQVLRRQFNEPRIHLAVNCASIGCPVLRREPYNGARLDRQLEDQGRRLVRDPSQFRIDRDTGTVHVSAVFDWFGDDFLTTHAPATPFPGQSQRESAILAFLSGYLPEEEQQWLRRGGLKLRFLPWDWSLNDASRT